MKVGKTARIVLDIALTFMIVFEMLIQFTGDFLHEVVGFAFFATVVAHMAFSFAWMKSSARLAKKGKLSGKRRASVVMACLLAIAMIALGVSSVAISGILSSIGFVWPFGSYALWVAVHTVSSYSLCALVVVHLCMHWAFFASAFKVPYNPDRRLAISTGVSTVAAIGVLALGATAIKSVVPQAAALGVDSNDSASDQEAPQNTSFKEPVSDRSDQAAPGGKHGRNSSSSASPSSSQGVSGESSKPDSGATAEGSGNAVAVPENDSSSASGICTLCRKRCPLSAPQCNKPYDAGLI